MLSGAITSFCHKGKAAQISPSFSGPKEMNDGRRKHGCGAVVESMTWIDGECGDVFIDDFFFFFFWQDEREIILSFCLFSISLVKKSADSLCI